MEIHNVDVNERLQQLCSSSLQEEAKNASIGSPRSSVPVNSMAGVIRYFFIVNLNAYDLVKDGIPIKSSYLSQ